MSTWAHVAGVIRVDDLRVIPTSVLADLKERLGPIKHYADDVDEETVKLPLGSEGSLQYSIYENPDKSTMTAYVITIWGDLRDYEETDSIAEWLKTTFDPNTTWIRQGVMEMHVGGDDKCSVFCFDGKEWKEA